MPEFCVAAMGNDPVRVDAADRLQAARSVVRSWPYVPKCPIDVVVWHSFPVVREDDPKKIRVTPDLDGIYWRSEVIGE